MSFSCFSLKHLLLRLSSYGSGGPQPPSQVISVLVARFFASSSSSGSTGSRSRNPVVSVLWDFEECNLPAGADAVNVVRTITAAIRSSGIRCPISITAFGDLLKLPMFKQRALASTGMYLRNVTPDKKTSERLMCWLSKTPPRAHIFLISGDTVFASALHRLRAKNHNILLASKTFALYDLFGAPTIMWDWCSLVEGKYVAGIRLNPQPNCDYYSCYDLIPLQYPFTGIEQSSSARTEEYPASGSDLSSKESTALSKTPLWLGSSCGPSTPFDPARENETDKSKSPGFFDRILKWFKFRDKHATVVNLGGELRGTCERVSDSSQVNGILIKKSLWGDIEPFINSPRGFTIISLSKTREGMARNLQKAGPACLRPLSELDMLHLVDALISEKKWVEESPSETLPFRVTRVIKKSSAPSRSRTGSRSACLNRTKSRSPKQGDKRPQKVPIEVSVATIVEREPSKRSRKKKKLDEEESSSSSKTRAKPLRREDRQPALYCKTGAQEG